jgi:hypothetical protein
MVLVMDMDLPGKILGNGLFHTGYHFYTNPKIDAICALTLTETYHYHDPYAHIEKGNVKIPSETFHDMTAGKGMDAPFFARLNYENYGGSPVLGVNAPVVVGHGISNDIAIKNLILLAKEMVSTNLTEKIKAAFKE